MRASGMTRRLRASWVWAFLWQIVASVLRLLASDDQPALAQSGPREEVKAAGRKPTNRPVRQLQSHDPVRGAHKGQTPRRPSGKPALHGNELCHGVPGDLEISRIGPGTL